MIQLTAGSLKKCSRSLEISYPVKLLSLRMEGVKDMALSSLILRTVQMLLLRSSMDLWLEESRCTCNTHSVISYSDPDELS